MKPHPLKGPNRLKLGVFSANADGGLAITDVPERWQAGWEDNLTAAQIADRAGLEFLLPIARWKGFGGKNRVREWSFETFTWAAGAGGRDRADRPVHDRACAAGASALCGEGAGDGRPHQPGPRRPQHRLRLEPEGIRHVRHAAGREGLRPGRRMDRHRRAALRVRRAVRFRRHLLPPRRMRSAGRRACRRRAR